MAVHGNCGTASELVGGCKCCSDYSQKELYQLLGCFLLAPLDKKGSLFSSAYLLLPSHLVKSELHCVFLFMVDRS